MKILFISLIFTLLSFVAFSQEMCGGRILDAESKNTIPFVYVENSSSRITVESDRNGNFEISAKLGDTLVFSSIGYFWGKHVVGNQRLLTFYLRPQVYEIDLVTKFFPYSYEELTQRVLAMKPSTDTFNLDLSHEPFQPVNTHQAGQLNYTINGAITELYNATNRHARIAAKAAELLKNKENILHINQKFNKKMVVAMTNVPDEYFDQFIAFCNFSDDFLLNTSDFQIIMTICFKYDKFLDLHPELKNSLN